MVSVCATCKGLQKHFDVQQEGDPAVRLVDVTLTALRRSSTACRPCALLLHGILLYHSRFANVGEDSVNIIAEFFPSMSTTTHQDHLSVELRWQESPDGSCGDAEHEHGQGVDHPDLKLEFFTDPDVQPSFSAIGHGLHLNGDPLQESGLRKTRRMIAACLANHSQCPPRKPRPLPRRILDLAGDDPSRGIRLHETKCDASGLPVELGEYIALSYCWGTGRGVPQTASNTLKAHLKNISWKALPKTFQEAILFAKSHGFRFLWIDSLCVVQDDAADKLQASLELDRILGNAFFTIAATSAADPSKGLFAPTLPPFKIQATDSKGSFSKVYVREQPTHWSFKVPYQAVPQMNDWELPSSGSHEEHMHAPLLRRAWAYVERLLSPRVLHFTPSEMILECQEGFICECGRIEDAIYDTRSTDPIKRGFASIFKQNDDAKRIDSISAKLAKTSLTDNPRGVTFDQKDALQLWSKIVTEFTARSITYDSDRLPAIAGVAKICSNILGPGYAAGQWTNSALGLLWYPYDSTNCHRPKSIPGRNVPTWSWASVEGSAILFDNVSAMDLACSASFLPDSSRNEGTWSYVSSDKIELTASMAAEVLLQEDDTNEYSLVRNGIGVEFTPDVVPLQGDDIVMPGDPLVCVLVSMTFRSSIVGLVLKKSSTNPQTYRRVGRLECYECYNDGTDDEPEDAERLFELWFPEADDLTQLDDAPRHKFVVV